MLKVSCEVRTAPLAEECRRRGLFWGCVCRGRCPSDTPLAALPANDGAAEGSVARSRDEYYDHSARNLRALWNVQRGFLEFFLNGFEFPAFYGVLNAIYPCTGWGSSLCCWLGCDIARYGDDCASYSLASAGYTLPKLEFALESKSSGEKTKYVFIVICDMCVI